jgi:chaperonin GroES
MKLVPLGEKVVVRQFEAADASPGGILLPDDARQKPQQGRVLSVGDGRLLPTGLRAKQQIAEGDRVVFPRYAGMEVEVNGEKLLIMDESDILAIVT